MEERNSVKLSKSILDMKFMKRTKERVEKEVDDAEGKSMYSNEVTEEMQKLGNTVFLEISIPNCKDLIDGRLSFSGMNPEIEKLMSNEYTKQLEEVEKAKEKEITDAEMAKEYSTVVNTISNKFKSKRNKNKFMKPVDNF